MKVGVRFRGNANNGNCSPRNLNANNHAANTNANFAGAAKVDNFCAHRPCPEVAKNMKDCAPMEGYDAPGTGIGMLLNLIP